MSVFADEQDVYGTIGRLFEEMCADEAVSRRFRRADTVVRYRVSDPDAVVTADMRIDSDPAVYLGPCELEPEVVMSMAADTAHRFFLGQVNVTVALARGEIEATGPVDKILRLVPVVKPFFPRYAALLQNLGRTDLVPA